MDAIPKDCLKTHSNKKNGANNDISNNLINAAIGYNISLI